MRSVKKGKAAPKPKPRQTARRGEPGWVRVRPRRSAAGARGRAGIRAAYAVIVSYPRMWAGLGLTAALGGFILWFILGGAAAALADAAAAERDAVLADAGYVIAGIEISGASRVPERDIRRALSVSEGDSTFALDAEAARERIEGMAWVRDVRVRRAYPDRILVQIVERVPAALWQHEGATVLIDTTGAPIAREGLAAFDHLPLVVGKGAPEAAQDLIAALERVPLVKSKVAASVRAGERRWNLRLDSGIEVRLPESGTEAALAELEHLLGEKSAVLKNVAVVDLRFDDRTVIRLRDGAAERLQRGQNT